VEGNHLYFTSGTHKYFLSFSIIPPKDYVVTAATTIKVNNRELTGTEITAEFVNGSSDWIVAISPGKNLTVTIDWDRDKTLFSAKIMKLICQYWILVKNKFL